MNELTTLPAPTMQWPMQASERMQLCREIATARLVPPAFQKSPADIFLAMNTIERLKLDFFMTIGECYVVQNKLGFSGKLAQAILNSSGRLAEPISHTYEGDGDNRTVTTSARLANESHTRSVTVRLGDAKTRNENWSKIPDQMLAYNGARTWGRRHAPEILLGMLFEDEVRDMIDVTPAKGERALGDPAANQFQKPQYAEKGPLQQMAETGSTKPMTDIGPARARFTTDASPRPPIETPAETPRQEPFSLEPPEMVGEQDRTEAWHAWCQTFVNLVRASISVEEIERWLSVNFDTLDTLTMQEPKMWRGVENAINLRRMVLQNPAEQSQ